MVYESLMSALEGISFPAERRVLIERIGGREIRVDEGRTVKLRQLLNACTEDRYEKAADVANCPYIIDAFERHSA